jgi:hypothetical protein
MWRSCFINTHIIFNFVLEHFWHDPSIQDVTSVPHSSWCRHRSKVFSTTWDSFDCFMIDDLTAAVATCYDPTFLISRLGTEVCNMWRSCFIDTHIIFNFVLEHFWHDPSIQDMTSVPHSSWCRHHSKVFSTTWDSFPDLVTFVNACNRAPTEKHRASSQRSTVSSERSFASAPQPPPCTHVSPVVLNHGSLNPDQSARRTSHSRGLRSLGPHSHYSSPPNILDGTPIAHGVISVPWRHQGSVMQRHTGETSLQARPRRGRQSPECAFKGVTTLKNGGGGR